MSLRKFLRRSVLMAWIVAAVVPIASEAQTDVIRTGRFTRGTGTNDSYQSFVIPLDLETGLACSDTGGLGEQFYPWNPALLGTLYHYNATNPASATNISLRIPFTNPIAGFGSRVGGARLYFGQQYRFGIYSGQIYPYYADSILLRTFQRTPTNFIYLGYAFIPIPSPYNTNDWNTYLTNGYEKVFITNGLTTIVRFDQNVQRWGTGFGGTLTLTHIADPSASNYVFQVGLAALTDKGDMVVNGSGVAEYCRMYNLEFESRLVWRSVFIDQPQFDGQPLPPAYQGKSLEELLTNSPPITTTFSLPQGPTTYTNLDQSPELRRHPILDQFVTDMRRDPVALARYVHNEIDLTDAVSYNDNGSLSEISVNPPGVSRGALATFLEGQGGPAEQCALLVYLLRQAGTPAVYVYPPHNTLTVLDARLSRLLRVQFRGAVNAATGQTYTTNKLIPVNYPWVAAYVGTNWVHLFPWLKDTELVEGLNLYDYTGSNYRNGFKWITDYFFGKTNILSLASGDDTPSVLFPKFVQNYLAQNAPGISMDDLGVRFVNRRKGYARWEDFPKPFSASTNGIALDSLSSPAITNVFAGLTNIFDTFSVEVASATNSAKKIASGEIRLADLQNRRFLIRHEKTGTNTHDVILSLAAFRTNATGPTNFTAGDALLNAQYAKTNLTSTDDWLNVTLTYRRHRALPISIFTNPPSFYSNYPAVYARTTISDTRPLRKGDLAAICINAGRVSKPMLNVHAQELWNMERALSVSGTNVPAAELYQGETTYLMGMAYYENVARFREQNQQWHKMHVMSQVAHGLAKLSAKRVGGLLPNNGDITLIQPNVDMSFYDAAVAFNGSIHSESGAEQFDALESFRTIDAAHSSAEEHQILNFFFQQSDAISTVKLLQLAEARKTTNNPGIFVLTPLNYSQLGDSNINGTLLKNADAGIWKTVTNYLTLYDARANQVFMTPGAVTNNSNSYKGVGAFIWSPIGYFVAAISANQNGGFANNVPDVTFNTGNAGNFTLRNDPAGDFYYDFNPPGAANKTLAPDNVTFFDENQTISYANSGYYDNTPVQKDRVREAQSSLIITPTGNPGQDYANAEQTAESRGWLGWLGSAVGQSGSAIADPVNSVTGEFYVDDLDLVLPGPMPLSVRRNYSSLNLADNQFGQGWKLNYMPFLSLTTDSNVIYAAEMDGSVVAYQFDTNNTWIVKADKNPQLDNRRTAGIGSTANRFRARVVKELNGPDTFYKLYGADGSLRTFKVMTFTSSITMTRPYLTQWQDHRGNSHTYEFGQDATQPDYGEVRRVQSANGNFLGFYYDVYGHIIEAYAGDGRRLKYEYDQFGDLVKVTRADASELAFEYEHKTQSVTNGAVVTQASYSTHLLLKETKPDGRLLVNQYDGQRRVTNQLSTVGADLNPVRNASFVYSNNFVFTNFNTHSITGYTLIYDVFNKVTRHDYTNSLITKITDSLNQTNLQEWYADNATAPGYKRSLKKLTDRRGLVTEFQYDGNGNVTNTIVTGDLTGEGMASQTATNKATYNTNSLPLEIIDPAGNKVAYAYHTNYLFLPEQVIRYAGSTAVSSNFFTYYNVTNTFTNAGVIYTNLAFGLMKREVRAYNSPAAATNEWSHDGRGFITQQVRYAGTTDSNVVVNLVHNDRGELIEQSDAVGRKTKFDYDGLGRPTAREVFESGQTTPLGWDYSYYNPNGELVWSDGPRFNPEDYVWRDYDGAGRQTQEIRWRSEAVADGSGVEAVPGDNLYATSFYEYDGFGNLTRSIDPRGTVTTNTWDAVGRLLTRTVLETNGTTLMTERLAYNAGGDVTFHTNALGGLTEQRYTSTGKPTYKKSPDGSTNGWTYYVDGRLRREYQSNGAYWETTYDDANRRVNKKFYTANNTLLATNLVEMDQRGNVVRHVDAAGNAFTNRYDGLDRVKSTAGPVVTYDPPPGVPVITGSIPPPVQQASTNYFDAAGVVTTNLNALGEKSITFRDALGRVTRAEVRDAANTLVRESTMAYSADHQGVTTTNGSGATAIVSATFTDNDGHNVLAVTYPAAGVREFALRYFDATGNATLEAHGAITNAALAFYTGGTAAYDGLHRVTLRTDRDNALTTFQYDALGDLTNRVMPGSMKWQASYNNAGQLLKDYNLGTGGAGARTNTYAYFTSSSAFAGKLQTRTDARGVVCTYAYDDWLRPLTNAHTGSLAEHNLTTTWRYDVRGLVTNVTETFATTNPGPATVLQQAFDAYGQFKGQWLMLGGVAQEAAQQDWNAAGRRRSLGLGVFAYQYGWRADGLLASATGLTGGGTYTYDTAGQLLSRTVGTRGTTVTSRDGASRVLGIDNTIFGSSLQTETLSYTGDGLIASHTVNNTNFNDSRSYLYADLSRRLIDERQNLDATKRWTNTFTYDSGTASGPGLLTKAGATSANWTGGADTFSRINTETNTLTRRQVWGTNNGPATMTLYLDGQPQTVTMLGTQQMAWRALIEVGSTGAHQLKVSALHPSGKYTAYATNWFTNNVASQSASVSYDGAGNVTSRTWTQGTNGPRTQTFAWDAKGRLNKVTERDSTSSGYDWSAAYDPFGRRLSTTSIAITNGVTNAASPVTISQYYDPQVEFLELGTTVSSGASVPIGCSRTVWKLYGPDLNGTYGGLNGLGGFEAIIPGPELFCPVFSDARGNVMAVYDGQHGGLVWNASRITGYGSVPGYKPLPLGHGADIVAASAWRDRWGDVTGLANLGARYYDMVAGRMLSFDPMTDPLNVSGYTLGGGDPIGYFDADGRLGKRWVEHSQSVDVNGFGSFFDASFSGAAGAILQGVGSIPSVFGQAREGMAQANQEISTYTGGQAFLANTLRLPANFAFGTTALFNDPLDTVPQIPKGILVDFPTSVGHNIQDFANNPSIYGAFNLVENGIQAAALVEGGAALYRTGTGLIPPRSISTPYGPAIQASTAEAQAMLQQVQNGATVYKGGFLGRSEVAGSQFLSLENPLNPGFAVRYGIPPQNADFNFVLTGRVQPGSPVITRPAPPVPPNLGGALEAVTTPGSFRIDSFHMP